MENETLATELLKELKASARRWFIAFCIMVGLEIATIIGFMWYITLPVAEEQITVDNESGNANYIGNDMNGDINNGTSDGNEEAQSDSQ